MNGMQAAEYLTKLEERVELIKKDNTNKFWCYKMKSGRRAEFAFDSRTTSKLNVRADMPFPEIDGISNIESLKGKSISTSLGRVFSGGMHVARYKATVETVSALNALLDHFEKSK